MRNLNPNQVPVKVLLTRAVQELSYSCQDKGNSKVNYWT